MNILVIEDDHLVRKSLAHFLLEAGHTVCVATNGEEAGEVVKRNGNINLVICDVMMPKLTGPSFLLTLKSYFQEGLPAIIIISGDKVGEDYLKKLEIPYNFFLQKPIDFTVLGGLVESHSEDRLAENS